MGQDKFLEICRKLTETMGLTIREVKTIDGGGEVVGVEPTSKWRNARAMPKLIRYLRVADMIEESTVRDAHEEMRKQGITRGLIVASTTFSRLAMDYAESRPIDLYNEDKLQSLLQQINM